MSTPYEPWPVRDVQEIDAIVTRSLYGKGTEDDVYREILQIHFTYDGRGWGIRFHDPGEEPAVPRRAVDPAVTLIKAAGDVIHRINVDSGEDDDMRKYAESQLRQAIARLGGVA